MSQSTIHRPTHRTAAESGPQAGRALCHRHPRHVWIASCPDCTSWHLAALRARRRRPAQPVSA
jgi:hypothetical protein